MNSSLLPFGNLPLVNDNVTESVLGDDKILLMCSHDSMDRCYSEYAWKYLIAGVNVISIAVNIFHLFILKRIPAIRGTPYLFVLQQMTVSDIYASLPTLRMFCVYHRLYYGKDIMVGVIFATIHDHCGLMRYNVLAAASLERYLAICHPLGESACVQTWSRGEKVKLASALFWVSALIFAFSRQYLFRNDLCIWAFYGPGSLDSRQSSVYLLSYVVVLTITIVVCNIKVLRELKRVSSQKLPQRRGDKLARQAVYYVIIINIGFYAFLVPAIAVTILVPLGRAITKARWIVNILYSSYGIFNVVIYGWVMKTYRKKISAILLRKNTKESRQNSTNTPSKNIKSLDTGDAICPAVSEIKSSHYC